MPIYKRYSSKKPWTKEEIKLLKRLINDGLPFTMMVINGRSAHAIKVKAKKLCLQVATVWSKKETDQLIKAVQAGVPTWKIRIKNHRTRELRSSNTIRAKVHRLGLLEPLPRRLAWSALEIQQLKVLVAKGHTAKTIKALGFFGPGRVLPERSANALAKMAGRLGLGDPARKERAKVARRMVTPEFSKRLNAFIRENGKKIPAGDIAVIFGVSSSTIRGRRTRLGIQVSWKDAVAMPDSRFKSPKYAQARSEKVKKSWAKRS